MSTTEEFLRLMVEIKGAAALPDLKKALADVGRETQNLSNLFGQNAITEELLEKETRRLAASKTALKDSISQLEKGIGTTTNKMAGLGQSFLQTGRVVQDFAQGGVGGVLNNIEGFAMAVGGGPGLAGALTVAGVAAFVAKPYIVSAAESMGLLGQQATTVKGQIEELKKKIEELEKKPGKVALDMNQLNDAKIKMDDLEKRLAAFNAGRVTAESADLAGRTAKAGKETMGSEGLKKAVFDTNRAAGLNFGTGADELEMAELKERQERLQRMATEKSKHTGRFLYGDDERADFQAKADAAKKVMKEIQVRNDAADIAQAEKTVGGFLSGDIGEVGRMKTRAARTPGAFTPEFSKELGKLPGSPEEWAMMKKADKDSAKESEDIRRAGEMKKKDDADKEERKKIEETARREKVEAEKEDKRAKDASTKEFLARAKERVKETAEREKTLGESDIDEAAAVRASQLRSGELGGKNTARGVVPLSKEKQEATLSKALGEDVARAAPELDENQQAELVAKMVQSAFKQADQENAKARVEATALSGKSLSATEKAALSQEIAIATTQTLLARLNAVEAKLGKGLSTQIELLDRARSDRGSRVQR